MKKLILILLFAVNCFATDWYIDAANGANSNSGRLVTDAFAGFWESGVLSVWDSVAANDRVFIYPGTYTEFSNFDYATATKFSFRIDSTLTTSEKVKWIGIGSVTLSNTNAAVQWLIAQRNQIFYNINFTSVGYSIAISLASVEDDANNKDTLAVNTETDFLNCDFRVSGRLYLINKGNTARKNFDVKFDHCTFSGLVASKWPSINTFYSGTYNNNDFSMYNCTVYFDNSYWAAVDASAILHGSYLGLKDVVLKNNVISGGTRAAATYGAMYFNLNYAQHKGTLTESNNIFWAADDDTSGWWAIKYKDGVEPTLNASSLIANPQFYDAINRKYFINEDSPAYNMPVFPGARKPNIITVGN